MNASEDSARIVNSISILLPKERSTAVINSVDFMDYHIGIGKNKLMVWLFFDMEEGHVNLFIKNKEKQNILGLKIDIFVSSNLVGRQKVAFEHRLNLEPLAEESIKLGTLEYLKKHSMSKKEGKNKKFVKFKANFILDIKLQTVDEKAEEGRQKVDQDIQQAASPVDTDVPTTAASSTSAEATAAQQAPQAKPQQPQQAQTIPKQQSTTTTAPPPDKKALDKDNLMAAPQNNWQSCNIL